MSQRPRIKFRKLDGILLLDKPRGPSSNQALQRARHLFRAAKGGHAGSLDPLATGLLPLCFGEATKIAGRLLGARKAYDVVARLGQVTDTDDAEGRVLHERPVPALDLGTLDRELARLTGRILQRPPIYSALKRGGEPLYAKARRGEEVEVEAREVDVHEFSLLSAGDLLDAAVGVGPGNVLRLRVECGSGTYVRSLVRDLGEALGCGAHVAELRRLWVDPFRNPRMWTFAELEALAARGGHCLESCLLPLEAGMDAWSRVEVDAAGAARLAHGQAVDGVFGAEGEVAVFGPGGRVLGLGTADRDGLLRPRRMFAWACAQPGPPAGDGAG
jgi:tRNA pseudouridine55 synthase